MLLKSFTIFLWHDNMSIFFQNILRGNISVVKKKSNVIFYAKRPITHFHLSFANAWGHISQHVTKCFYKLALLRTFSVQFSHSVMSNSLWPHGLQHARLPCPSTTPRSCSNSCPLRWWCYLTIIFCYPLLLLASNFPSIRVFSNESVLPIRWPKYWSFNFSIQWICSTVNAYSVLPMNIQDWLPSGWTDLISLLPKGLSRVFSNTTV